MALDTAIVGAAGGLAAQLTGGKFASGFITAAFANLYNKWQLLGNGAAEVVGRLKSNSVFKDMWDFIERKPETYIFGTTDRDLTGSGGEFYSSFGRAVLVNPGQAGIYDYKTTEGGWYQQGYLDLVVHGIGHLYIDALGLDGRATWATENNVPANVNPGDYTIIIQNLIMPQVYGDPSYPQRIPDHLDPKNPTYRIHQP